MLTPELELCEVSPTCGADVHKGVCPRNPARQVRHRIGPVGEPVPVTADETVEQAAEVLAAHRNCGMWVPIERRRWQFPCGVIIDVPEDMDAAGFGLSAIDRAHVAAALRDAGLLDDPNLTAERDRARDIAVALEGQVAAVLHDLPDTFRAARRDRGLSLRQVAAQIEGVGFNTLSRFERRINDVNLSHALAILRWTADRGTGRDGGGVMVCAACRRGNHQHDRHTGAIPGTRAGDDAGCPNAVRGGECDCSVVLPPMGQGRRHCQTCRCTGERP